MSLSPEQVSEWTLSHPLCNTLSLLMDNMYNIQVGENDVKTKMHKEEGESRKRLDTVDRNKIIEEIKQHTNPLTTDPEDELCNIINGRIANKDVNVDNSLDIGMEMARKYEFFSP